MRLPLRFVAILVALVGVYSARSYADPAQLALARNRLETMLCRQQQTRNEIAAEQQRTQAHLAQVQSFQSHLDPATNAQSIAVANQAVQRDQSALSQIAERLGLADRAIATTQRAIANLVPPPPGPSPYERARQAGYTMLANAMDCGQPAGDSPVSDISLSARLFSADFCGLRTDQGLEGHYGLSTQPTLMARLNRIVARLDTASAHTSVRVLSGCPADGGGAFSTSTTSYIGACWLGPNHTDDEVAFIVAHERAHVTLGHNSTDYVQQFLQRRHLAAITTDPHVVKAAIAYNLAHRYRDEEYEADLAGAETAMTAGFSPQGAQDAMNHFETTERPSSAGTEVQYQQASADHASAADRRRALENALGANFWQNAPAWDVCPTRQD